MDAVVALKAALLRSNSRVAGELAMAVGQWIDGRFTGLPGLGRLLVDALQPADPLRSNENLPPIEVVIPFVLKDVDTLRMAIEGALTSSRNPIGQVTLVTPKRTLGHAPDIRDRLLAEFMQSPLLAETPLKVVLDEEIVPASLMRIVEGEKLEPRDRGWVVQQLVKLSAVLISEWPGCLVVDADTVLMFRRTWLASDGRQILMIGQESREPFFSFASKFLDLVNRPRFSFVTHHQLMQRTLLESLLVPRGGVEALLELARTMKLNPNPLRAISEYEIYGAYLSRFHPELCHFASWGNGSGNRSHLTIRNEGDAAWALSVSYHHYLSADNTPATML